MQPDLPRDGSAPVLQSRTHRVGFVGILAELELNAPVLPLDASFRYPESAPGVPGRPNSPAAIRREARIGGGSFAVPRARGRIDRESGHATAAHPNDGSFLNSTRDGVNR